MTLNDSHAAKFQNERGALTQIDIAGDVERVRSRHREVRTRDVDIARDRRHGQIQNNA